LKVDVYVPIEFEHGVYKENGLFGGVVISENVGNVEEAGQEFSDEIGAFSAGLQRTVIVISVIGLVLIIVATVLVSRNITVPIQQLTDEARSMEKGEYNVEAVEQLLNRRIQDEVTDLSRVFKQMAKAVQMREKRLKDEIRKLRIEIDEGKKEEAVQQIVESESFQNLQDKVEELRERRRIRAARRGKRSES
jgi:nitrogen fixation/metabolism regulation signal transduction histidine kinase